MLGAQTVARALALIDVVVKADRPLTLAEIVQRSGFEKSSVHRSLRTLEEAGYVVLGEHGRGYRVGAGLIGTAARIMHQIDISEQAGAGIERLVDRFGETVSLIVRARDERLCIDGLEGRFPVRRVVPIGERLPLYSGTSGKAMLAFVEMAQRNELIRRATVAGESARKLHTQLAAVRRSLYLATIGDRNVGVGGLAVPVFSHAGIAAALTVSGPAYRWTMEAMVAASGTVIAEAQAISVALGANQDALASH